MNRILPRMSSILFSAFLVSSPAFSYDTLFEITGRVQAGSCTLESSKVRDVNLGEIVLSESGLGGQVHSVSDKIDWSVTLDCPEGLPVIVTPKGTAFQGSDTVLALNTEAGSATGLGVETEYSSNGSNWTPLRLNTANTLINAIQNKGEVTLKFRGYYKQMEKDIAPGTANATLDLEIVYQ